MAGMKNKNNIKKPKPWLGWVVGVEFAGIILIGIFAVFLVFRFNLVGWNPFAHEPAPTTPGLSTPTSVAMPTSTALPEQTSGTTTFHTLPVVEFDPSTANHVAPADVLGEVEYFPPEGADGFCSSESNTQPLLDAEPEPSEWLSPVKILTCGWRSTSPEPITVTVTFQGSVYATEEIDQYGYSVEYSLPLSSSMGLGDYAVVLEASSGRVETIVNIFLPSGPRLYTVGEEGWVLYGFAPNETVRLFAYRPENALGTEPHFYQQLNGWKQYQVDSSGMLIVKAPKDLIYYVIGDISGMPPYTGPYNSRPILAAPCGEHLSYLQHIYPGSEQRVNASVEATTFLRSGPGLSFGSSGHVSQGTLVAVIDGPVCADDSTWWFVLTRNEQQSGWLPEYQADVYLLQPYPKNSLGMLASGLPDLEFDPETANTVPPEDVFEEVVFFGKGAGFCDQPPYPEPTIIEAPHDGELMSQSSLVACGWENDEVLTGTIQYPDGRTLIQYIETKSMNEVSYGQLVFTPILDDPAGTYTLTLEGRDGIVTAAVEVRSPDGPRLYRMDPLHIFLYHFVPQEQVRLLCYQGETLSFWQDLILDQSGNQPVMAKNANCVFVGLGQSSGEVHELSDWKGTVKRSCGGLPSRLKVHEIAQTAVTDGSEKPVYSSPGFSQEIIRSIPEGTLVNILNGPHCVDGSLWWPVEIGNGTLGSMPEEQNGIYLLEPMQ